MTFDPRKSGYLKPSEEAIYAFMCGSNHWLTKREIALRINLSVGTVTIVIDQLSKLSLVNKRLRNYGFDNGILEFKSSVQGIDGVRKRRRQEKLHELVGVEPLHRKLRRIVGARRAREADSY